ncbi:hypothetical protein CN918_30715 [Priestia megaterium]|nr:hypothetical protein CN918_30715 [Priestia megaterium]
MHELKMLHKQELQGTCYVEMQPGRHNGEFWKEESFYFTDETFSLFTQTILSYVPSYSLWGKSEITAETWLLIANELNKLAEYLETCPSLQELRERLELQNEPDIERLLTAYQQCGFSKVHNLLHAFSNWLTAQCLTHSHLTILGI